MGRTASDFDANSLLDRARRAIGDRSWDTAIADCDILLARAPGHEEASVLKAYALRARERSDDLERALATLREGLEKNPDSLALLAERGNLATKRENWETAEFFHRRALDLDPDYVDSVLGLTEVFTATHRGEEAQLLLEDLQPRHPEDPDIALLLGWALLDNGDPDRAIRQFKRIVGKASTAYSARIGEAAAHLVQHHYTEAKAILLKAIADFPHEIHAVSNLAWTLTLEEEDLDEAERRCREVLSRRHNHAPVLECLGVVYFHRRRMAAAESYFRRAIEADPSNPRFPTRLGFLFLQFDDFRAACRAFDQAIGLDANYDLALLGRGAASYALGDYRSALRDFRRATALRPRSAHGAVGVGLSLARLGRLEDAAHSLCQALESVDREDRWRVRLALAQILVRTGEEVGDADLFTDALAQAEKALEERRLQTERHENAVAPAVQSMPMAIRLPS